MIKLDDNLLQEIGLSVLPAEDKEKMLAHIYETLEMRVGMELAKQMSDAQLSEFEEFINRNDEQGALRWLESNFPNYKDVVAAEFEKLKSEIRQVAPQIVASNQQQVAAGASAPAQYAQPAQQPQQPIQQDYSQPPHYAQPPQAPAAQPQQYSYSQQPYQQPMQPHYAQPAAPQPQPQQPIQQDYSQPPHYAQPPQAPAAPYSPQLPQAPGMPGQMTQPYPPSQPPTQDDQSNYGLAG